MPEAVVLLVKVPGVIGLHKSYLDGHVIYHDLLAGGDDLCLHQRRDMAAVLSYCIHRSVFFNCSVQVGITVLDGEGFHPFLHHLADNGADKGL